MTDHTRDFYIDGAWRPASGRRHDRRGRPRDRSADRGRLPRAGSDDVDRAVAAARNAFAAYAATPRRRARSPCFTASRKASPGARKTLPGDVARDGRADHCRRAASISRAVPRIVAETIKVLHTLRVRLAARHDAGNEGADRRLRLDHAVEFSDQPGDVQGRAGAGRRLHDGAEAKRSVAAVRADHRRDPARGRRAARRVQPRQWRWRAHGSRAGRASRCRHGVVHRLDARGRGSGQGGCRHGQAGRAGARRQVAPTFFCPTSTSSAR